MTGPTGLAEAAVAGIGALVVLAVAAVIVAKARRERRERRHGRLVAEARPLVMQAMLRPGEVVLDRRVGAIAEEVVASLLGKVRGADRDALVRVLDDRGALDRARRELRRGGTTRRLDAIEMLGSAGDEASIDALVDLLDDPAGDVRTAAARSLGRIGAPTAISSLFAAYEVGRISRHAVTLATIRTGGPAANDAVVEVLDAAVTGQSRSNSAVRVLSADLAGVLGATAAAPVLVTMLDADDVGLRRAAAGSLGRLGLPSSAAPILQVLRAELDADELDVTTASVFVEALGRIGHRSAIPVLEDALGRHHRLSLAASAALAEMGPRRSRRSIAERAAVDASHEVAVRDVTTHEVAS